jgi:hypothetical protein
VRACNGNDRQMPGAIVKSHVGLHLVQ